MQPFGTRRFRDLAPQVTPLAALRHGQPFDPGAVSPTCRLDVAEGEMARKRGNREGTIFKRADGRWAATVDLGWYGGK